MSSQPGRPKPKEAPKMRRCLAQLAMNCPGDFKSAHAGNRICPRCTPLVNDAKNGIPAAGLPDGGRRKPRRSD